MALRITNGMKKQSTRRVKQVMRTITRPKAVQAKNLAALPGVTGLPIPWSFLVHGKKKLEAAPGFEPGMEVLQTSALPLGYAASRRRFSGIENLAGPEPWSREGIGIEIPDSL